MRMNLRRNGGPPPRSTFVPCPQVDSQIVGRLTVTGVRIVHTPLVGRTAMDEMPTTLSAEPQDPRPAANRDAIELQRFFLERLDRLVALEATWQVYLRLNRPLGRLLEHTLALTYRDCVQAGVQPRALQIL